jgi:hypothetical protein
MAWGIQAGSTRHPMARFIGFLIFMGGLFAFGLFHLVKNFDNPRGSASTMTVTLVVSLLVLVPDVFMAVSLGKSDVGTPRAQLLLAIFFFAFLLDAPTAFGWNIFPSDSYWMQIPCEVAAISFAPAAVVVRVRQRFWRSDWRPKP